jgi:glycosyltransferase involved in cell wall biosynthesis
MAGVPAVASPTLYGQVISDGEDGLLAETAHEWEVQLARLIQDPQLRRQIWRNQRRRVASSHSLSNGWDQWLIAWSRILRNFHGRPDRRILLPATA